MNINATLFGEMLIFAMFVYLTYRWVWPYIIGALDARQAHIAAGIAAADKSLHELAATQAQVAQDLQQAKRQALQIIEEGQKRSAFLIDEARDKAKTEGERLLNVAKAEIAQSAIMTKQALMNDVAKLAILASEKVLAKNIDQAANNHLIEKLIAELEQ